MITKRSSKYKSSDQPAIEQMHLIAVLKRILDNTREKYISIGSIVEKLKDEGLLLIIALIALPTAIPIPTPPGLTTLTGIPLCILTAQLVYRQDRPWIPKWIANRQVKVSSFQKVISKAGSLLGKLTLLLRPRYKHFTTKSVERIVGVLAVFCSVSIALPILFGNAVPSAGVFIMTLGLLYQDGLAVLVGMLISVVGILVSTTVAVCTILYGTLAIQEVIPAGIQFLINN
jgi:hypothetical protein